MADFLGLMKQAAELKTKMEAMQAELDKLEVEGTAGVLAGKVKVEPLAIGVEPCTTEITGPVTVPTTVKV